MAVVLFYFHLLFLGAPTGADLPYTEISNAFEKNDASALFPFVKILFY